MSLARIPLPESGLMPGFERVSNLRNALLQNKIKQIEAEYAPLTTQADAASKLAYANLMGPQFLAKLMGNQNILANMPDEQKRAALNMVYGAGTGQSSGGSMNSNFMNSLVQQNQNPIDKLKNLVMDKITNAFNGSPQKSQVLQNQNALLNQPNLSQKDIEGINSLEPGQSYVIQGNQPQTSSAPYIPPSPQTWSEKTGAFAGDIEEGKKAGEIRAQNVSELGDVYQNVLTSETTLNDLSKIINSPEFEQIRQLPLGQQYELGYYKKFGTPAQQKKVGQFIADMGTVVQDAASNFKGAFRRGEQQLVNNIKVNESDTLDVARGKLESMMLMKDMLKERASIASKYMQAPYHMSKINALAQADSQINGDELRKKIEDKVNPMTTIRNKRTGEVITIPTSEARDKYGIRPR